ncbi:UDP-N-acetylglucosamine 1-carboxyvinyltransferase [Bacillota bacterium LX-D]|nr:UDP-N-acetylglucosamine 1-carboxyvinyltransferase [Bacillota bacterium LX-D]
MEKILIKGGKKLQGKVQISGAKNAALAVISAAVLAHGETVLENVPRIADVEVLLEILHKLGAKVAWLEENTLSITVPDEIGYITPYNLVRKLRASNLLLGALLARRGQAEVSMPGGCNIGIRPMDLHLKGFQAMGAKVEVENGYIKTSGALQGSQIYLDFPSVGATENIMMAAAGAQGTTMIGNVAKEPEIVDLANFLNTLGAKVRGAGTDIIKIEGARTLQGARYSIIPDRIEAGTFMLAAAITGSDILIQNVIPHHLQPIIAKLRETGIEIFEDEEEVRVVGSKDYTSTDIKTLPFPGFPTDMQSQMMAFLSLAKGTSVITETVYENRLQTADELKRMGAHIKVEGQTAVVFGVEKLCGSQVRACDLRSGAALVLAGLAAEGQTKISNVHLIDRGYEKLVAKLSSLGADIERICE